ncbi:uncharacterized protein LOC135344752 [Halichondria panicea]|uniref:uncharacterized protein LOC135344752 n=1 Tax=Halichondria panicea TaxID=6063 RepID=UPI00312B6133
MLAMFNGCVHVLDMLIKEFNSSCHVRDDDGYTLLHQACRCGHIELIDKLVLEYGLNPADKDNDGNTPLHIAASIKGRVETVRHLISKHSADIDCTNNQNSTPSMLAVPNKQVTVLNVLVKEFNSNCHVRDRYGQTLLHQVCGDGGHIEMIDKLVMECGLNLEDRDGKGNTPLHIAAWAGHVETVRHLINKHSADTDCTNNENDTPLMVAWLMGHSHVLDVLVREFNSSCHIRSYTLLHCACERGHIKLIDKLVNKYGLNFRDRRDNDGNTSLHIAALFGHVEAVRHLISKHSIDIDCSNNQNVTPLMLAVLNGHIHVFDELVKEFNSCCHVQDCNGQTLLHYACDGGHIELIDKLVLEYGLSLRVRDDNGDTPLHFAAVKGHFETVEHLISKYNVYTDVTNNSNNTPLMLAALKDHDNVLDVLVKEFNRSRHVRGYTLLHSACDCGYIKLIEKLVIVYGLDLGDRNNDGNTPLHIGAKKGHVETVRHLITQHKVETNITNNVNSTPLCLAAQSGHEIVIHALIKEFNCSPHVRGCNGQTLLHYACQNGHVKLLNKLLVKYKVEPSIRDNDGNTPLHILCRTLHTEEERLRTMLCKYQYWTVFQVNNDGNTPLHTATLSEQAHCARLLLQKYNAPLFVRNKDGKTALDLAKAQRSHEIVKIFKNHNSEMQLTYRQLDKLAKQEFGDEKNLTRIFVVGHPGAGKSTLVETIKTEGLISYFSTSTVAPHTAGIVPSTYDSNAYGRMILYDFAGDSEYYSSHAAIMESINTSKGSNIYLIVCDLSKGEEAAVTKYSYWLSFLSYNIKQFSNTIILPVGSHADVINKTSVKQALCMLDSVSKKFCSSSKIDDLHIEQSVALDCRKRGAVVNDIKELTKRFSNLVSLSPETSTLLGLLKKDFEHVSACKISLLISHIEDTGIPLPLNSSSLYLLIRELDDLGLLMVIEREGDSIENHIIILKISTFTSDLHKKLFSEPARTDLTKHIDQLKFSVGIIPESLLEKVLPEYITKESLLKLQYCQEIENLNVEEDHTLSQLTSEPVTTDGATKEKSHLFFPALCDLKLVDIQWPKSEGDKITLGWYAKCDGDRFDFFPTRFLHVLIVNLSHNFALKQNLPTRHRLSTAPSNSLIAEVHAANPSCCVWSTGLHWLMKNGVEVFVDMPKDADSKELIVLARSDVRNQAKCSETLELVIQKVVEAKMEFCAGIVPSVYLLDPSNLKDEPFTNAINSPKYALRDIEEALAEGTEEVADKDRHCFSTPIKEWISPTRWAISYWNLFFPMDTFLVHSALQEVTGAQWKLLGISLPIPWNKLEDIENNDSSYPGDIAKKEEVIRLWMSQEPTWIVLVEALSQSTYGWSQNSSQISQEHNVPLQKKILENDSSLRPDKEFLQSFAAIIGSRWQCLASPLSLTSEDIVSIKRETRGSEPIRQALVMLQKWATRETATYGQLRERLRTLSVFHI